MVGDGQQPTRAPVRREDSAFDENWGWDGDGGVGERINFHIKRMTTLSLRRILH